MRRKVGLTPDRVYREANRRRHKILGMYLSLLAWRKRVDCIVLSRLTLLDYMGLKRMRNERIDWLKADVKSLFPHPWSTVSIPSGNYGTLYLSRYKIPSQAKLGIMYDQNRVVKLNELGLRSMIVNIPKEEKMINIITRMAHGIGEFTSPSS